MPKKTKKQKQRSDVRREQNPFQFQYSPVSEAAKGVKPIHTESSQSFAYIRRDIIKTVILGSIFLAAEFGLYVYTQRLGW